MPTAMKSDALEILMTDISYGISLAQPGSKLDKVADYDLYFSSGWPFLRLAETGSVPSSNFPIDGGQYRVIIPHKLKYPPFVLVWSSSTGLIAFGMNINSVDIQFTSAGVDTFQYFIFALPLTKSLDTATRNTFGQATGTPLYNYGIRYNEHGIENTDDRDTILDTSFRSPLIHKVINGPVTIQSRPGEAFDGSRGLLYNLDLPYNPLLFAFMSNDNENFIILDTIRPSPPKLAFVRTLGVLKSYFALAATDNNFATFVIFKDPVDLVPRTEVST